MTEGTVIRVFPLAFSEDKMAWQTAEHWCTSICNTKSAV